MALANSARLHMQRALRRGQTAFMSDSAVVVQKEAAPAVAAVPKAAPAPVVTKKGASFTSRLSSFLSGLALGSGVAFYALHKDVWDSTVQLEQSIYNLKTDVVSENRKLRQSVAKLEKEIAAIKAGRA